MSSTPSAADQPPPVPIGKSDALPSAQPRLLAILAVAGIAFIHIAAAPDAERAAPYLLALYMALAAAAVPLIVALLFWESSRVWTASAVYALGPLIGYLWSRGIGLPGDSDDLGDWMNSLGIASLFVESSLLAVSLVYVYRLPRRRRRVAPGRPGPQSRMAGWPPSAGVEASPLL